MSDGKSAPPAPSGPDAPKQASPPPGPNAQPAPGPAQPAAGGAPDTAAARPSATPPPKPDPSPAQQRVKDVAEAGRRLADAVSPAQQAELSRARSDFQVGNVGRDVVGGNSYTYYNYEIFRGRGDVEFRAYRMTPEELEQPFVPASGFDELAETVGAHRLVAVRGQAGTGKASALLKALTQILPDDTPILRLEPGTDLTALSCERLPPGAAVVLYDLSGRDAVQLDPFTVERLTAELEQHQCRLGVTLGDDVVLRPVARLAVAELAAGPTPRQVFDKHLSALLVSAPAARSRLLDDTEVQKLLGEQLTGSVSLDHAARLAEALAKAKDDPVAAAATVRTRMSAHAFEEFVQWFRDLPGLRAHCMAIALAVLNRLPREIVSSAADRLEALIAPPPDTAAPGPAADPFAPATGISLSVLRAEATSGVTSTPRGDLPIMALRFVHSEYAAWVLRHVWREFDSARPAVVQWLGELGGHANRSVRVRTATAVGVLALEAFDFLYSRIIGTWAQDADPDIRDSAAIALGLPASDKRLNDVVRTIVQDWSADGTRAWMQATAARTFGGSTGLARPSNSLRQLSALAEIDNINVAIAVATSLGEMVMQGTVALAGRVLAEVDAWTRQANQERRLVGRLAFLQMSHLRGAPAAMRERPGSADSLPTLLLLTMCDRRLLDQVALLWADGLNSADVHRLIGESLTEWACAVEPHVEARTVFVDVMGCSAADRRTGAILARKAGQWRTGSGPARKTAESLLTHVTGVTAHG